MLERKQFYILSYSHHCNHFHSHLHKMLYKLMNIRLYILQYKMTRIRLRIRWYIPPYNFPYILPYIHLHKWYYIRPYMCWNKLMNSQYIQNWKNCLHNCQSTTLYKNHYNQNNHLKRMSLYTYWNSYHYIVLHNHRTYHMKSVCWQ